MEKKILRIVLTGTTGLLGGNLFFEIIKKNMDSLDRLDLIVLGRGENDFDIKERMKSDFCKYGLSYFNLSEKEAQKLQRYVEDEVRYMHIDLDEEGLGLEVEDFNYLTKETIDVFFHVAALTDFRNTPAIIGALRSTNVKGTERILQLVSSLRVNEFYYVGSAYSCGNVSGKISPDYIDFKNGFRNPYEATKLEAEIMVRNFSRTSKVKCKYLRPSTICGRLMEQELGLINKFDVFYAWAAFFLRLKMKEMKDVQNLYERPITFDIRLFYNVRSGLNMVPADYAAKVIYQIFAQDLSGESYYLVNEKETPHDLYMSTMLETLNIDGSKHISDLPEKMNRLERFYYKTVGSIYTPYIISDPMLFDTDNLRKMLSEASILCPVVDKKNFRILMEYAKRHNFGVNSNPVEVTQVKGSEL